MATYKPDQGKLVRRMAFWGLVFLIVWGGQELYTFLVTTIDFAAQLVFESGDPLDGYELPLLEQRLNWAFLISWGVVILLVWGLHRWLNKPKRAEFLIETDAELDKVTWPNRKDAWTSTVVVMVFVFFLALFLLASDFVVGRFIDLVVGIGGGGS